MSRAGCQAFLSDDGVGDLVILHGGPTTVFKLRSMPEAARLATAISDLLGLGAQTILTAARDRLNMKLTREL